MEPLDPARRFRHVIRRLRFRWNASAHYHAWLLSQIPLEARSALDVGCGDGRFTRCLAALGLEVDAIDRDSAVLELGRGGPPSRIRWIQGDILAPGIPLREEGYDVVTIVAALHFMPSREVLARLRTLVSGNGTILVIGLYQAASALDGIATIFALPLHAAMSIYRTWRGDALTHYDPRVPLKAPRETLRDIRAAVGIELPGARMRRRLFWRYTLQWRAHRSTR